MSGQANAGAAAGGGDSRAARRSSARLAAVQALYQAELSGKDAGDVIAEFEAHRLGGDMDGEELAEADTDYFRQVVIGVVSRQRDIDPLVDSALAEGWRLARLDTIMRAILRCATCEFMERSDVPAKVIINEYMDIAHAFFSGEEPRAVNGILDNLARETRPAEFGRVTE
ncbi:MAG: transcription antitermination factor NusB [Hyphomicrobiales bacterium]